jgi:cytochrome P450
MVMTLDAVPTAAGRLPGLGHLVPLVARPLPFVRSLHRYGDIVRIYFGTVPVYLVTHPAPLRDVLVNHARDFDKGRLFDKGKAFLGEGLLTAAGEPHQRHRRLIQPAFHRHKIEQYAERMRAMAADVAGSWREGEPVDLNAAMNRLAFAVVTRSMFAVDVPRQAQERLHDGLPLLLRASMLRAFAPAGFERLPLPVHRRYAEAAASVRSVVDELLAVYRGGAAADDNLVALLDPVDDGQLRDELVTLMIAGTETTGATMAWLFYELDRHDEVRERLHADVDEVVGDGPVRAGDVERLTYTPWVLRETLRLHSLWLSTRRALRPVRVGEVTVPAGTELAFSLDALHRHPDFHPDPAVFRPERWAPGGGASRDAYLPFLTGARQCVGDVFAWTEMLTVVATIASVWRLRLAPGARVHESVTATVRPGGLTMLPVARRR